MNIDIIKEYYDKFSKMKMTKWIMLGVAGILLLLSSSFPMSKINENKNVENEESKYETNNLDGLEYKKNLERDLEDFISNIKGIDKVKVMITMKSSGEKILKDDSEVTNETDKTGNDSMDSNSSLNLNSKEYRKNTTVIFKNNSKEEPYIVKEYSPEVEGVVICAKKITDNNTKKELINVVVSLFGIEPHKISITEMK